MLIRKPGPVKAQSLRRLSQLYRKDRPVNISKVLPSMICVFPLAPSSSRVCVSFTHCHNLLMSTQMLLKVDGIYLILVLRNWDPLVKVSAVDSIIITLLLEH